MHSALRVCLLLGWLAVPAGFAQMMPSAIQTLPGAARTQLGNAPEQSPTKPTTVKIESDSLEAARPVMTPKPLPAGLTEPSVGETPAGPVADSSASLGEMARKLREQKKKQSAAPAAPSSATAPPKTALNAASSAPAASKPSPNE
jgi:hypothetical protein